MEQEIFVHHKKCLHAQRSLRVAHHVEQLVAGLEEVDEVPFAAEKCRRRTEVAAHRTTHRRNDGRCRVSLFLRHSQAHDPRLQSRNNLRMPDRRMLILAEVAPHPRNALAAHDVVRVNHVLEPGSGRHVPADHDRRTGRKFPYHAAHLAHLAHIHNDRRNSHDVVGVGLELARKILACREIEHRRRRRNILLDHHDPPRPVKHPQREPTLRPRHLVVVKLHRVDGPAAKLIILRIRPKHRRQQNARGTAFRVNFHLGHTPVAIKVEGGCGGGL